MPHDFATSVGGFLIGCFVSIVVIAMLRLVETYREHRHEYRIRELHDGPSRVVDQHTIRPLRIA